MPRKNRAPRVDPVTRIPIGSSRIFGGPFLVLGLILSLGLTACAIDPAKHAERVLTDVPAAELSKARAAAHGGEPAEAASAYLQLAESAATPAKEQLQLYAAEAMLAAGDANAANRILTGISKDRLTATQRELVLLLEAELALQRGRASETIAKLAQVSRRSLPADLEAKYLGTEAAAYRLENRAIPAAESLDALDRLLKDNSNARLNNQVSLLFTLAPLGPSGLKDATRTTGGRMKGWAELAALFSGYGAPSPKLDSRYRKWRSAHMTHPALPDLAKAYFATLAGGYAANTDTLVLLPSGGRFGIAGNAIKDGIRAAYDADRSGNRPNLSYRSSGYDTGVDGGADLVIGPLQKPAVASLGARSTLPVPTLALNRADGKSTKNLYQFSLAPEDEAINAANYASTSGLERAALLYPRGPFGDRLANAFRTRWRTLGGRIAGQKAYPTGERHYRHTAATLLAEGEPDFVFLVAVTKDAQAIYTSLREAGASIPVVATSHVYSGDFDPNRDAALSGLYFVDIPWILDDERSDSLSRKALRDKLPNVNGPLARLYAMGIDGYRLAPHIAQMAGSPGTFFPGETGGLTVDSLGRIRRQLMLAQFGVSGPKTTTRIDARASNEAATGGQAQDADPGTTPAIDTKP